MKTQIQKLTVYDYLYPVTIKVFSKTDGAPYEIRVDDQQWTTCENGIEVDDEIAEIIKLYGYSYFPRF